MGLNLQILEVRRSDDIVAAFRAARNDHADAINVFSSPFLSSLFREIIVLSAEYRLPAIYQWKEHVEAGGLVSFGPNLAAMYRQTATIVVKILTGAKPSELQSNNPQSLNWRSTAGPHRLSALESLRQSWCELTM
jgi:putative ABC transport system substrate-binding protein